MDTALPILAFIFIGALAIAVVLLVPALYLHAAARTAKVRKPYGTAILVTFLQLIIQGIFSLIVGVVSAFLTPLVGLLLGIPVLILSIFIDVWIIQGFYATRFGKAFLIWLLTIAEVLATALIVFAIAAVAGAIGGSGRTLNLPSLQYQLQQTPALGQYYLTRLTRWSSIVNIGVLALAAALWFKTFKSGKDRPFWALFALGWTLAGVSYVLSRAVGVQLADASTFHHSLYIAGYALIGAAFWTAPERGTPRQAWIVAGVLLVSLLVYAFVVTPLLSHTISGGGRGGPWEMTEPLRNRGITAVSLAVIATLAVEAWLRLKGCAKTWQAILLWPALGVTLAFVTDWITIFARKSESLESVFGLTVALFFVQIVLLGIGLYQAFRLDRADRQTVPAPAPAA